MPQNSVAMGKRFSRQELFDQVWTVPARTIANEHGISEVAFAKYCQEHSIPVPPRGHWAKAENDRMKQPDLPRRGIGMPEFLEGGRKWSTRNDGVPENLEEVDLGPTPEFAESEEKLFQRMKGLVGAVPIPTTTTKLHTQLVRLINEDEARKRGADRYNGPLFTSPFERRRLRFLSGIFQALARFDVRIAARGKNPADFEIRVGDQHSSLTADYKGAQRYSSWMSSFSKEVPATEPMTVAIWSHRDGELFRKWEDRPNDPVEGSAFEIVAAILAYAELRYRQRELWRYEWLTERQTSLRQERVRKIEEARQAEIKATAEEKKARVDQLLAESEAYRKAQEIRSYVATIQAERKARSGSEDIRFQDWVSFALGVADSIDPVPARLRSK